MTVEPRVSYKEWGGMAGGQVQGLEQEQHVGLEWGQRPGMAVAPPLVHNLVRPLSQAQLTACALCAKRPCPHTSSSSSSTGRARQPVYRLL